MAPTTAKPWSSLLPAATSLLLVAMLMAKFTATAAAAAVSGAGETAASAGTVVTCSTSKLPESCTQGLRSCGSARISEFISLHEQTIMCYNAASACCNDLNALEECAKCSLLKEVNGLTDVTLRSTLCVPCKSA
jgi:hypothetical protein